MGTSEASPGEEFPLYCSLCGTLQYARRDQIGKCVRCSDCHSPVPVRAPQTRRRPAVHADSAPPRADDNAEDDDYRLSEPPERQPWSTVYQKTLELAEQQVRAEHEAEHGAKRRRKPAGDVVAERARELLREAEAEAERAAQVEGETAPRPLFHRALSFLFDLQTLLRWCMLTLLVLSLTAVFQLFLSLIREQSLLQQLGAIFVGMLLGPTAVIYLIAVSVFGLTIMQDTAMGRDKIQDWPGIDFLEWAFHSFHVINPLWVASVPGFLAGQLLVMLQIVAHPTPVLLGLISAGIAFPVLFLSVLEGGSPLSLWSGAVFRGFCRSGRAMGMFYLASAGLALAALVSCYLLAMGWIPVRVTGAVGLNLALLVYFRLLGRLAGLMKDEPTELDEACESATTAAKPSRKLG